MSKKESFNNHVHWDFQYLIGIPLDSFSFYCNFNDSVSWGVTDLAVITKDICASTLSVWVYQQNITRNMSKCPGVAGHEFPLQHSFIQDAKLGTVVPTVQKCILCYRGRGCYTSTEKNLLWIWNFLADSSSPQKQCNLQTKSRTNCHSGV